MNGSFRAAVIGELLWDQLRNGMMLGGAPSNVGFRLNKLNIPTAVISRVGQDELGDRAIETLETAGLDCRYIQRDALHDTGTVSAKFDGDESVSYEIVPNIAYDYIGKRAELLELAQGVELLYYGALAQRSEVSKQTLRDLVMGAPQAIKVLDLNLRELCWNDEIVRWSVEHANILKMNEVELLPVALALGLRARESSEVLAELLAKYPGVTHTVLTKGSRGAITRSRDGQVAAHPGFVVPVADVIGCGDSFIATFAEGVLQKRSLESTLVRASVVGALVATQVGGMPELARVDYETIELPLRPRGEEQTLKLELAPRPIPVVVRAAP